MHILAMVLTWIIAGQIGFSVALMYPRWRLRRKILISTAVVAPFAVLVSVLMAVVSR